METIVTIATIVLILGYIAAAVWTICTRQTLAGSIFTSAAFLGGGFLVIPVAQVLATILFYILVGGLILVIVSILFN